MKAPNMNKLPSFNNKGVKFQKFADRRNVRNPNFYSVPKFALLIYKNVLKK